MEKEYLRMVAYQLPKKSKEDKVGLFHVWGTKIDKKGNDIFFALVEDLVNGKLIEIKFNKLRFLSDEEIFALSLLSEEIELENAEKDRKKVAAKTTVKSTVKSATKTATPAQTSKVTPAKSTATKTTIPRTRTTAKPTATKAATTTRTTKPKTTTTPKVETTEVVKEN